MLADTLYLHPLGLCQGSPHEQLLCRGYNFWSGIGSDISEITLLASGTIALIAIVRMVHKTYLRHFECHEDGCPRHGRYVLEGGVRCCDLHHPALDERPHTQRGHVHRLHLAHVQHLARLTLK